MKGMGFKVHIISMLLALLTLVLPECVLAEKSFFKEREQGWYYGKNFKTLKKKEVPEKQFSTLADAPQAKSVDEQIKDLQKAFEASQKKAYLSVYNDDPLKVQMENMEAMLMMQMKHMNASQQFAKIGRLVALKNAYLDEQIRNPYHHEARKVKNKQLTQEAEKAATKLMRTHGLYFFFDSDCGYCQMMGPVVKYFADKHNAVVVPISLNGGSLPDYPNPAFNNGIAERFNIQTWPAIVAINPDTEKAIKLANRPTSITELEETALLYAQLVPEEGAHS